MSSITGGSGDLFTHVSTVPASSSAPGTPYQIVWDAQGNMYIAYQNNTWAKYTNTPFGPPAGTVDSQPLGMP